MLDFDKIFSRNDSDNIMLVSENAPFGNRFLSPEMKALINNYTQSAKAKSAGTTPPKNTAKKKDSFLEGFNDPYGEKNAFPRQSLAQKIMAQFTNPVQQTPQSPMIKTETPKYALPNIGNSNNNYSEKKVEAPKTELRASPAANTSEDDAFREGFNYYNDKELMFPNTELHAKPKNYGVMFPNTQLHASPSENKSEDDAFLDGFNDPYGEKNMWEEQEENVNTFQRDMTGIAPMGRQGKMWCWIAAASMVDEYYHPENHASQEEIAAQLGKGRRDGGYIEEDSELGKGSRSCTTSGFSDRIPAKELTYKKIQEELHGKHPIVLLTDTGDDFEDEHYVVIVGCYTDGEGERYVVVNETREKETMTGINGLQRHIPYEQIKGVFSTGRGADQKIKAFYTTRPEKDSYHK